MREDSQELTAPPGSAVTNQIANNPSRATILTRRAGKKKHADGAACFSKSILRKNVYGFLGLVAGAAVLVVVVLAGLVAGFSVVVVAGFLFSAVITSVVKSMLSLE